MLVDNNLYRADMYHGGAMNWPITGSLWCHRWAQFAHVQVTRVYEHCVEQLDHLTTDNVHWESYSAQEVEDRAPAGLSSLCWRDQAYWMTWRKLVFDVFIKDYAVHRVMRQFGLCQVVPVLVGGRLPDLIHAQSRRGGSRMSWAAKMESWLAEWADALEDCV